MISNILHFLTFIAIVIAVLYIRRDVQINKNISIRLTTIETNITAIYEYFRNNIAGKGEPTRVKQANKDV